MSSRPFWNDTAARFSRLRLAGSLGRGDPRAMARLLARAPFTLGLLATMFVLGVTTGSLWHRVAGTPLLRQVGFGLPAIEHGQLLTLVTSIPFALCPWMLATITLLVVVMLLPDEVVAGPPRAVTIFLSCQTGGYLLAALL